MDKSKNEVNQKLLYIQALRTIAIISVIILHCISNYFVDLELFSTRTWWGVNIINSFTRFGVPIFFMISGYLMFSSNKDETISKFIKKRYFKILIPFLFWNLLYYIQYISNAKSAFSINEFIYKILTMGMSYHFWFVYTLLAIYLFVPIFKCFLKKAEINEIWYLFLIVIIPSTIAPFLNKFFGLWIPAFNMVIEGYFGFFVIGYILGKSEFNKCTRVIIYILALLGVVSGIFGTYYFSDSNKIDFFFNGGYQFNSYFISAAIFIFFKTNFNNIKNEKICKFINTTGDLSFGVYLIHVLIINILEKYIISEIYINIFIISAIAVIISFTAVFLISKIKYLKNIV